MAMSEKSELRKALKALGNQRPQGSEAMTALLLNTREYRAAGTILAFYGVEPEPDTLPFIRQALEDGKTLCLPKTYGKGLMDARRVTSPEDMVPGRYNIPEPREDLEIIPRDRIDLIIVPAVALDHRGYRLGHGAGYYDRYLAGYTGDTIALCFEERLLDRVPVDEYDLPVAAIVTEKRLIHCTDCEE